MDKQKIGSFSREVIELLQLDITAGTPIYIGSSNIEHIKSRHPYEYEKYFPLGRVRYLPHMIENYRII